MSQALTAGAASRGCVLGRADSACQKGRRQIDGTRLRLHAHQANSHKQAQGSGSLHPSKVRTVIWAATLKSLGHKPLVVSIVSGDTERRPTGWLASPDCVTD